MVIGVENGPDCELGRRGFWYVVIRAKFFKADGLAGFEDEPGYFVPEFWLVLDGVDDVLICGLYSWVYLHEFHEMAKITLPSMVIVHGGYKLFISLKECQIPACRQVYNPSLTKQIPLKVLIKKPLRPKHSNKQFLDHSPKNITILKPKQ